MQNEEFRCGGNFQLLQESPDLVTDERVASFRTLDFEFVLSEYGFYRLNIGSNIGSNYKFAASAVDADYDGMFEDHVTFELSLIHI